MATRDGADMPGDDFFDVVRHRHRDIDIVLLPPEAPVDGSADPTADIAEPIDPRAADGGVSAPARSPSYIAGRDCA